MIDLYTWTTPNGRKVSVMLEECGLEYSVHPVNIRDGDQFKPEFVKICPAEVPSIPGCATQGESFEELLKNLYQAVEGCLSVDISAPKATGKDRVVEIIV